MDQLGQYHSTAVSLNSSITLSNPLWMGTCNVKPRTGVGPTHL